MNLRFSYTHSRCMCTGIHVRINQARDRGEARALMSSPFSHPPTLIASWVIKGPLKSLSTRTCVCAQIPTRARLYRMYNLNRELNIKQYIYLRRNKLAKASMEANFFAIAGRLKEERLQGDRDLHGSCRDDRSIARYTYLNNVYFLSSSS